MADETEEEDLLLDKITENAMGGIKSASGDGQSVTAQDLREQMEFHKYKRSISASRTGLGLRVVRLVPPGTTPGY